MGNASDRLHGQRLKSCGRLARAGLVVAVFAGTACRGPADALLVVSVSSPDIVEAERLDVLVSTVATPAKRDVVKFPAPGGHISISTTPVTLGLTIPGDIGSVTLSVQVFGAGDGNAPRASGTAKKPIDPHAGTRIDVPVVLSPGPPGGGADGSVDGADDGKTDGGGVESRDAPIPDGPTGSESGADVMPATDGPKDGPKDGATEAAPEAASEAPSDAGAGEAAPDAPTLPPPELTSKMVAYWKMDEDMSTTASDSSGNGNTATLQDLFFGVAWVTGHIGVAFRPAGSGWFSTQTSASFDGLSDQISVAAWIYQSPQTGIRTIVQRQRGTGLEDDFWLGLVNDQLSFRLGHSGTLALVDAFPSGWQHLAVTYDASTMKIYVNGALAAQNPGGTIMSKQPRGFNIAASCHNADANVVEWKTTFLIDEMLMYARALGPSDVAALAKGVRPF
jgi:Concanavalin A-like lectin/glucanases superfamily